MKIREQFRSKPAEPAQKKCPGCGHTLTIEKTDFFETEICENCFEYTKITDIDGCCRTPDFHRVRLLTAGASIQVREQCQACGYVKPNSIGGLSIQERNSLPALNESLRASKYEKKYSLKSDFGRRAADGKAARSRKNWLKEYSAYLDSPEWRHKRELVLKRDNYICQACLTALATQVHHKSYEFVDMVGSEPSFDLVAICSPCHERIEQMKKDRRNIQ